jgi:hypothetical protein
MSTEETMDQNLEAMLGAEAAAATNPIQTSIKGLSKEQRAVLKDMVDRTIEEQDGGGPDVAIMPEGEFRAFVSRMIK